jgi:hypothetical protein
MIPVFDPAAIQAKIAAIQRLSASRGPSRRIQAVQGFGQRPRDPFHFAQVAPAKKITMGQTTCLEALLQQPHDRFLRWKVPHGHRPIMA